MSSITVALTAGASASTPAQTAPANSVSNTTTVNGHDYTVGPVGNPAVTVPAQALGASRSESTTVTF